MLKNLLTPMFVSFAQHIMKPLEDKSGPYAKLFTPADLSTMFCNIPMIEVMCKDLLKLFEQAASEAPRPADAAVGKAYIAKKIALTASFSAYCANQSKAIQLYEQMKKKHSSLFNTYLASVRDHPQLRGLGLLDWLIKPVQRVTKYPLLLRELEKHTPENHSDRENTVLAAMAVQELVDQVNIAAKQMETTHHIMRIADEVGDIPSSLQLRSTSTTARYFVTEGKFIKVSHGKHQERQFWLFSDFVMYARPNVASLKKYSFKGTIVLSKSNYEDLPDGNEFGANAIRITRLDSKKTYIIYCKDPKQKAFWLTNITELKDLDSKGMIAPQMPTIGVAKIVSDSPDMPMTGISANKNGSGNRESDKTNNSLVMWSIAVRIAGWTNEDESRTLFHECAVKAKPFGKEVDYCFMFSDGWMGTKIKMFKTAQSSKNAVDFKVFVPFELMESFSHKTDTAIEVKYVDPDGGSKNGSFTIEYETPELQREALRMCPQDQLGRVRESLYTKRISHQTDTPPVGITRSTTSASLSFSSPSLPSTPAINGHQHPHSVRVAPSNGLLQNGANSNTFGSSTLPPVSESYSRTDVSSPPPYSSNAPIDHNSSAPKPVPHSIGRPHSVRSGPTPALSSSAPNPHLSTPPKQQPALINNPNHYGKPNPAGTPPNGNAFSAAVGSSPASSSPAPGNMAHGNGYASPSGAQPGALGGPKKTGVPPPMPKTGATPPAGVKQPNYGAAPSSTPGRVNHQPSGASGPPPKPSASKIGASSPSTSPGPAKGTANAPPMPNLPKYGSSAPSPSNVPPKGPGKLSAGSRKWPPT